MVSSLEVAKTFNKEHYNVLRDIKKLEQLPEFGALNFEVTYYVTSQGKNSKMYFMTKDGFTLLVMGYTGEKAMRFKIEYINAFNKLEQAYRDAQFRIGDKKHQLECMELLCDMLSEEEKQNKVNYIKANTVVNKAVSNYFGFPKMLKKAEMNPDMLYLRENVLDDYVKLFDVLNDNGKVKEIIYNKYAKNLLESKGE